MSSKNFGISSVAVAPVPAVSGLTLTVAAGAGARFTTGVVSVFPAGGSPDPSTAEVLTVSSVVGDVLTIVRGAESSTARSIVVGDTVCQGITAGMWDAIAASVAANTAAISGNTSAIAANTTAIGTKATSQRAGFTVANDRVIFVPTGVLGFSPQFVPLVGRGDEYYGVCVMQSAGRYKAFSLYGQGHLGASSVIPSEPIFGVTGDDVYDTTLLQLPNGHLMMACHVGNEGKVHTFRSVDNGATWTERTAFDPGNQVVTHKRFSEAYMMRLHMGSAYTGTSNRIIIAFASVDPVVPRTIDTRIYTSVSDDEGATWSAPYAVTTASGPTSAGYLNDNTRPFIYQATDSTIQCIYSRVDTTNPWNASMWQVSLDSTGQNPGTPVLITACPLSTSPGGSDPTATEKGGLAPYVFVGRDGKYYLLWAESSFATGGTVGAIYCMEGDGKNGWSNKQTLNSRNDISNGYGRVQPVRTDQGVAVLYVYLPSGSVVQFRAFDLIGA